MISLPDGATGGSPDLDMSVDIKTECVGGDTSAETSDGKKMSPLSQGSCVTDSCRNFKEEGSKGK